MRLAFVAGLAAMLAGFALVIAHPAHAYTCEQVRIWHQRYGTATLLRYARLYGVTAAQKRAALRCLRSTARR